MNDVSNGDRQPSGLLERGKRRWRRFDKPTRRGLVVWGVAALVIAVPEIWGSVGNPWFYSISRTTGHLEDLWAGVRGIVVALIAIAAADAMLYRPDLDTVPEDRVKSVRPGRSIRRVGNGRLTARGDEGPEDFFDKFADAYLIGSAVVVAAAGLLASLLPVDQYWRGYVIYGLIAVFFVIIPNVAAYFRGRDFPFKTLFATVRQLERSRNIVTMIIAAGLAVLAFHLALYPWPNIHLIAV